MTSPAPRFAGLRLCLSLLTVYPVAGLAAPTPEQGRVAILLAPLAGVTLWLPCAVGVLLVRSWLNFDFGSLPPAVLGFALLALLTRGLHLDGLADTADALGSYREPAAAREIMRRGDVGPLGMLAVLFVVLFEVSLFDVAISDHHGTVSLLVAILSGRLVLLLSCVEGATVSPGSTMGAMVIGTVSRRSAAAATVVVIALCGVAASFDFHTLDRHTETLQALVAPLLAVLIAWPIRRHISRRLGGLGGDALGALTELGTLTAMLVMAGIPGGILTGSTFLG